MACRKRILSVAAFSARRLTPTFPLPGMRVLRALLSQRAAFWPVLFCDHARCGKSARLQAFLAEFHSGLLRFVFALLYARNIADYGNSHADAGHAPQSEIVVRDRGDSRAADRQRVAYNVKYSANAHSSKAPLIVPSRFSFWRALFLARICFGPERVSPAVYCMFLYMAAFPRTAQCGARKCALLFFGSGQKDSAFLRFVFRRVSPQFSSQFFRANQPRQTSAHAG